MKKIIINQIIKFWYNGYILKEKSSKLIFDIIYDLLDFESFVKYIILNK